MAGKGWHSEDTLLVVLLRKCTEVCCNLRSLHLWFHFFFFFFSWGFMASGFSLWVCLHFKLRSSRSCVFVWKMSFENKLVNVGCWKYKLLYCKDLLGKKKKKEFCDVKSLNCVKLLNQTFLCTCAFRISFKPRKFLHSINLISTTTLMKTILTLGKFS